SDRRMPLKARDTAVADEVRRYLDIALDFPAVRSVSTWGLSDGDSWLAYKAGGRADNRGLPYDRDWRRKPMRTAIEPAFLGSRRSEASELEPFRGGWEWRLRESWE